VPTTAGSTSMHAGAPPRLPTGMTAKM
jgi:hypothetical protein